MADAAGEDIAVYQQADILPKYIVNATITLTGTREGSFGDWAYAAGWTDTVGELVVCDPSSAPDIPDDFYDFDYADVKAAVFAIQTGEDEDPPTSLYGGREVIKKVESSIDFQVDKVSIYDEVPTHLYDGHINRNIRAAIAMIDLTKPYIWVKRVAYIKATDQVEVEFSVNGCITITEVSVVVNGESTQITVDEEEEDDVDDEDDDEDEEEDKHEHYYCNHLVPDEEE